MTDPHQLQLEAWNQWNSESAQDALYDFVGPINYVLDLGGYMGDWSAKIIEKYNPKLISIYEPIKRHVNYLKIRFEDKCVMIYPYAVSNRNGFEKIKLAAEGTSLYCPGEEEVELVTLSRCSKDHVFKYDLAKINIEGEEFNVIDDLYQGNLLKNMKSILIQPHVFVPDAYNKLVKMREQLSETHKLVWNYNFIWELWEQ